MPTIKNSAKNILAVLFGLLIAVYVLGFGEYLFRLNARYNLFPPMQFNYTTPEEIFRTDVDLKYLDGLKPYPNDPYQSAPNDWHAAHSFKDCSNSTPNVSPRWTAVKNCRSHVVMKKTDSNFVVADVHYSFDKYARRRIPSAKANSDNFLVFLGCSFTYGESVNDEETFPNLVVKKFGNINGYNLGMDGYGPNLVLDLLSHENDFRLDGIHGKRGVAIYTFIDHHIERLLGSMSTVNFTKRFSNYQLEDGKLVHLGSFEQSRPVVQFLFEFFSHSEMLKFFKIDFPFKNKSTDLMVAVTQGIKNKVLEKFGIERMIFVIYPGQFMHQVDLAEKLREADIEVIDFSKFDIKKHSRGRHQLFGDGHPSPLGYRIYSDLLTSELKKRKIFD